MDVIRQALPPPWALAMRVLGLCRRAAPIPDDVRHGLGMVWLPRAVVASGRSGEELPAELGDVGAWHARVGVLLTHGGPRTADSARERPVAAAEVVDPLTGRTPRALGDDEWDAIEAAFLREGEAALRAGAWALGVDVSRGRLWHSAVSPLLCPDEKRREALRARLLRVVGALRAMTPRVAVDLVVEDVAVGGLAPAAGVALAGELARVGASMLVVRVGGPHTVRRMHPPEPRFVEEEGPSLTSARWVRAALPKDVLVVAAGAIRSEAVAEAAISSGCCDAVLIERPLTDGKTLSPRA